MSEAQVVRALLEQKLGALRAVLVLSQQSLLLVDLEGLTPLLEQKNGLIRQVRLIDEALALHDDLPAQTAPLRQELAEVVQSVLENERTLEARIAREQSQLRRELRDFDQETRLKQYLERTRPKGGTVNLKK
jgi:anthranilate phosphoribosyltransferase